MKHQLTQNQVIGALNAILSPDYKVPAETPEYEVVNINAYRGDIPAGHDLVIMELGRPETALVLYGFDEVGALDSNFICPIYAFMKA